MKRFMAGVISQRYCSMKGVEQVPSSDVLDLMFVFVRVVTEGTVVVLEAHGSFCVDVLHGVGNYAVRIELRAEGRALSRGPWLSKSQGAARSAFRKSAASRSMSAMPE